MSSIAINIRDEAPLACALLGNRLITSRGRVLPAMGSAIDEANLEAVAHIQETKLTAAGPRFLNVQTGRLRRSARATKARIVGDSVNSAIGSNVKYAKFHEEGAKAHDIVAKGRALRWKATGFAAIGKKGKGLYIFRKKVHIPALPARRPFATGVDEKVSDGTYRDKLVSAILNVL